MHVLVAFYALVNWESAGPDAGASVQVIVCCTK